MTGQVVKIVSGIFSVFHDGIITDCTAKGLLKHKKSDILTGDFVDVDENNVITNIFERKNSFSRPSVANVDIAVIVISKKPSPDFHLIDKLIVASNFVGVPVIIVVNKTDLDHSFIDDVYADYCRAVDKIFGVSSLNGFGLDELIAYLDGKLAVFTGQSAVGKTSIVNAVFGEDRAVGELSRKTEKGKQTTTVSEIVFKNNIKIVDTPGFSSFDLSLKAEELADYYVDFRDYVIDCKYGDCVHIKECDCAVKNAAKNKQISQNRYFRYTELFSELKNGVKYDRRKKN
ncbi:MAG: ribosome small subunit-dependent GTPase A [Clostridia bacterium]|nr:ribosome small subunit-dependent GTPase A [Clostridia bacterium]